MNNVFPKPINISPISVPERITNNSPTGLDKQKYKLGISPNNEWYRNNTFMNTLPSIPDTIEPNKCVSVYNNQQNIEGVVCNYAENLNNIRGNQFGVKYQRNLRKKKFILKNIKLNKGGSTIVTDSPFYPEPNFNYIKDSRYKTYPHSNIYKNGMPLYEYPYNETLNNPLNDPSNNQLEHFSSSSNNECSCKISIIICIILVLITMALIKTRRIS
tara:strand:- start:1101 stop:1745 length:645 start_codon:yes stop_codon:yes gene_type:complete